jgi:hypothetical protein
VHRCLTILNVVLAAFPPPSLSQTTQKSTASPSTAKNDAKTPDYYPLKVGTKWHYQLDAGTGQKVQLVSEIAGVESVRGESLSRLEVSANGRKLPSTEHLQSKKDGVFRFRVSGTDIDPPVCLIKYPLKAGQTSSIETSASGEKMKVDYSEGQPEEVQVPAGKYQTIPCTITTVQGGAKTKNVYWFAADVGVVKQRMEIGPQTITLELTKYEAAK